MSEHTIARRHDATGTQSSAPPRQTGPLLDLIDVAHGPRHILGRFFLAADAEARARGIELHFATFEEMVALNRSNSESWKPLVPMFLPENGLVEENRSFCVIGRNAKQEAVTCQAGIFFDWTGTSFKEEAESLRLFYADPTAARARGETCRVTAPHTEMITGRISYSGGAWYRPDYRGRYIAGIMARLSRALAHARWNTTTTVAMISETLYSRGYGFRTGYVHQELGFELENFEVGPYQAAVVWTHADEMMDDLARFPEPLAPPRKVDMPVSLRRA